MLPLFPDEAYYWDWSRHLAVGYFDHPPVIAILIALTGEASTLGVRFGPIVAGLVAASATILITRSLAGNHASFRSAIVISVMPLAAAGLVLATPDAPLLASTAVCLYFVVQALQSRVGSRHSSRAWVGAGVALGFAFASKYTAILLPIAVVAAIALRPALRVRLREPGPYVACLIALVIFSPVLVWNARQDWVSFLFQLRHGLSAPQGSALLAAWRHEGDFFGGQAALASPILFVMLAIATGRALSRRANDVHFVLACTALLSFGFFVYSALRRRVEPNWPAPAYIPAIVLLATTPWSEVGRKWFNGGVVLAVAMSLLIYLQGLVPVLPLAAPRDPVARAFGWQELAATADSASRAVSGTTRTATWIGGDRYQEAAEMAFHHPMHATTFATNLSGRPNQYDLWPRFPDLARPNDNLLLVLDDTGEPHAAVKALSPYFAQTEKGQAVVLRRGAGAIGVRRLWIFIGWRGGWPASR